MTLIGPTGKDLFPCLILFVVGNDVRSYAFMVEAISRDEATGIAQRIAHKLMPPEARSLVARAGLSEVVTHNKVRITDDGS